MHFIHIWNECAPYHHIQLDSFHVYLASSKRMLSPKLNTNRHRKRNHVFVVLYTHKSNFQTKRNKIIEEVPSCQSTRPNFQILECFSMLKSSESSWFFTLLICVTYRIFRLLNKYYIYCLVCYSSFCLFFSIEIRLLCVFVNHIKRS